MKNLTLIFAFIISVALGAKAQSVAEFKFDTETHDFNKISQGKPVTVELHFTNSGTDDLNIFRPNQPAPV